MIRTGKILITRPDEDAQIFSEKLQRLGFETLAAPMLTILPVPFSLPKTGGWEGFVFTSARGVRFMPPNFYKGVPAFCVGARTAAEAEKRGFFPVISTEGDLKNLEDLLKKEAAGKRLLHICGQDVSRPFRLAACQIERLTVYKAVMADGFAPDILKALQEKDVQAIAFFSKRTAAAFLKIIEKENLFNALGSIKALCISGAVLEFVRSYAWGGAYAAEKPDAPHMIKLITTVCSPAGKEES